MTRFSAVFLDRDGTLIRERGYLDDPAGVELVPGAAEAVAWLNALGIPAIMVTNQSGIGRGYFTEDDFYAVQAEVESQLARRGSALTDAYYCPHDPESDSCDCRKPGPGMYREAAEKHALLLDRSLYIGDRVSDVQPARRFGGTGVLVRTGHELEDPPPEGIAVADDVLHALRIALGEEGDRGGAAGS